jgi:nucleotide-binding universal stress UspA family protein
VFHDVVIPLDGSEFAASALPVGVQLATEAGARARVIGIVRADAELVWTYDHVHDDAKRAGLDETDVEIRVHPDPADILLQLAADPGNVLCLASHDRGEPAATLMRSVGTQVIERVHRPIVVTGRHDDLPTAGAEVVVALDARENPAPILEVAAAWALRLQRALRLVTVYEPVPADIRNAQHYTRDIGPGGDPEEYLADMRTRVADIGLDRVDTRAIEHPISAGRGLEEHLAAHPARLLVLGGDHRPRRAPSLPGGVARHLLTTRACPLLIVPHGD